MESKIFDFENADGVTLEQYADFGSLPKFYADGVSQIFVQNGVVNFLFYQSTGVTGANSEIASAVFKASIPIPASLELANGIQSLLKLESSEKKVEPSTETTPTVPPLGDRIA